MIEQEVKLQFEDVEAACRAVDAAGGRLVVSRRLLDDRLFDTADMSLRRTGRALRVRRDAERGLITFKGPVVPGPVKTREELETPVASADIAEAIVSGLGYRPVFRSQKYRREYELGTAHLAVDETPFGVFVEIEGLPDVIAEATRRLGRRPEEYRLESYPALWRQWCEARQLPPTDMVFPAATPTT